MRVLITGGAGLIGSHCAQYYAQKKAQVIVLDNLIRSEIFGSFRKSVEYNWAFLGQYKNIKRILGDVRKTQDVKKALGKGVDVVIHAAGQPSFSASMIVPDIDFDINAFGTFNVLEGMRKNSPKATFIYCSSNKIYGDNLNKIPTRELKTRYAYKNFPGAGENIPLDQARRTPYGASKLVGDLYAQEYAHTYGLRTGIFRMGCVYGQRQFGFEKQGWETWFIIACLTNKLITIFGDGKQVRDLLYATDVVEAYDKFIQSKKSHEIYNIGGGAANSVSLIEFLGLVEKETGIRPRLRHKPWYNGDQKIYTSDYSKIKKELGWEPKVGVSQGIQRITAWVRENINYFK